MGGARCSPGPSALELHSLSTSVEVCQLKMENVSQRCNIGFTLAIVQTVLPPVRRLSRGCSRIRRRAVGLCGFRDVCADNTLKSSCEEIAEDCQHCRNIHLCSEQVLLWPAGLRQLN